MENTPITEIKASEELDQLIKKVFEENKDKLDDDFDNIILGKGYYIRKIDWEKLWEFEQKGK